MSYRATDVWYRVWMWGPPVLVVIAITWGVGREYWATSRYHAIVDELESNGVPVTTTQIRDRYKSFEPTNESLEWKELSDAVSILREMSRDSVKGLSDLVPPNEPWPAKPFAELMSEQAQPLLEKMDTLLAKDVPIRLPYTIPNRYMSVTQYLFSSLQDQLNDEFRLAYHNGDSERALSLIQKSRDLGQRIGDSGGLNNYSQQIRNRDWFAVVRKSMKAEFWDANQLREIRKMIGDSDLSGASSDVDPVSGFVAWEPLKRQSYFVTYEDEGERSVFFFGATGVHALAAVEWLQADREELEDHNVTRKRTNREREEDQERFGEIVDRSRNWVSVPYATMNLDVRQVWRISRPNRLRLQTQQHNQKVWTLIAVYLREYQVENGEFPRSLDGLRSVGANVKDWTLTTGEQLGYRADSDGSTAVLWTDAGTPHPTEERGIGRIPYSERTYGAGRAERYEMWFNRKAE
ncbi:hypothetical protein [Rhodopirellula bahusiensis]|uniref:Uncharacterized protein n=1 Tax=Rhodopirellula bahusiensis TaxID=2014065 RepID=A0A2G1WBY2_9BACT|nr:hypothetical protein [Rhodopirellula bahusiensis]PHQ36544.1 hypothetical protein CEE69_03980 [Rhodopirellula bahusiensis]